MKAMERFFPPAPALAGVLVGFLLCGSLGRAQTPLEKATVADVIIYGNRLVPADRIRLLLKTRPGAEYAQETVNEDVRKLYETKQFGNVQPYIERTPEGKVIVKFGVVEYPSSVQDVVYNGAKHLKPEELNTITGIRKGVPLNPSANQIACQSIVNRYTEMGRPFASCELLEGKSPGDTRVVFSITEGPTVKVRQIDFEGNTFVNASVLNTKINSGHEWFGAFGGTFRPIMADLDVVKLEEYYRSFGYHNVQVARELRYDKDGRHVDLIFHIHEGPRYKLAGLELVGNKIYTGDQLLNLCKEKRGDWFNEADVNKDKKRIEDYYGFGGRNSIVRPEYFYPPNEPGVCLVQYQVQERPPAKVGEIKVIGNDVTKQNVILRQVPLYPGQILSYPDIRAGEKNLARLGIFEMDPEKGGPPMIKVSDDVDNDFKEVLIFVKEAPTGSLTLGVGVNSDAGLTGQIILNERNFDIFRPPLSFEDFLSGRAFRGAGQEFRAEIVPGTQVQRYSVSFREPYLFDSPYSLDLGAYYYARTYDEYDETRLGARVGVGRRLGQFWSASVGLRVEEVGIHNVNFFEPLDFQAVVGDNLLVGLRAGVTYDSRDSYLRPTEGMRVDANIEQITGDFTYPVLTLEGHKYFTVYQRADGSGRHVLALFSQFSLAGANAPVYERFYAGGFRTVRGFEFRGISPLEPGRFGGPPAYRDGGDFMLLNSLEYSIPLTANDQIQAVGFLDSGTVERRLNLDDYRMSAGFGLRIAVPLLGPVPLALDFGFPIVKATGDREQVFSFSLGLSR